MKLALLILALAVLFACGSPNATNRTTKSQAGFNTARGTLEGVNVHDNVTVVNLRDGNNFYVVLCGDVHTKLPPVGALVLLEFTTGANGCNDLQHAEVQFE